MKRVKIVCTIGPSSNSLDVIKRLINSGMNVARLNFSHGNHENHKKTFDIIRQAADELNRPVAIMQDLSGPKIRIGTFVNKKIYLKEGDQFIVTTREIAGTEKIVSTNYKPLAKDLHLGNTVLLADGKLELLVKSIKDEDIITEVVVGGELSDHKGINCPGISLSTPALTEKDKDDLKFGKQLGVDYIAISFVRKPEDVKEAKQMAGSIPLIAKIEKPEAFQYLEEITDIADGLMVARGDLGVEAGAEKVPLFQKKIIKEANLKGKLVITATQMLESMVENPMPSRADVSDIANAVLDGSDALMLSQETAVGKYPVEAVSFMNKIIQEIEKSDIFKSLPPPQLIQEHTFTNAIATGAADIANKLNLKGIVVYTHSGKTSSLISDYRPLVPVWAFTDSEQTYRQLSIYWGIIPVLTDKSPRTPNEMVEYAKTLLLNSNYLNKDDEIVITLGYWGNDIGKTNTLIIEKL